MRWTPRPAVPIYLLLLYVAVSISNLFSILLSALFVSSSGLNPFFHDIIFVVCVLFKHLNKISSLQKLGGCRTDWVGHSFSVILKEMEPWTTSSTFHPSFSYTFHCWCEGLYSTAYFYLAQIKSKVSLCIWNLFSIIIYRNRNNQTNSYFVFFQRKGKTVGFLWRGRSRARTGLKH